MKIKTRTIKNKIERLRFDWAEILENEYNIIVLI